MCACTEPVRTDIGAACVEYGRPKWPITMLNHTDRYPSLVQKNVFKLFFNLWHPTRYARTARYEKAFLPKGKKRPLSLRSLGLASLLFSETSSENDAHYYSGTCVRHNCYYSVSGSSVK